MSQNVAGCRKRGSEAPVFRRGERHRFYQNTRNAVDQYLAIVDKDVQAHIDAGDVDKPMLYVIDVSRSGMFSVKYMSARATPLMKKHAKFPESYIAYVTDKPDDSILVSLIDALTSRKQEHTRKVYKTEEFEQAIDWLRSVQKKYEDA